MHLILYTSHINFFYRHEIHQHNLRVEDTGQDDARNSLGYYKCCAPNCGLVFKTNATLKR
jgi:predicted phosphoadenosine phosphosulfate sulfurtransferase